MTRPVIFVCVVTYNQRDFIEICLRSILDQQVDASMKVLVGDDASTDGTSIVIERLVEEYGDRLQHFRRTTNMGAFANMSDLLMRVDSGFVARVDGDDYWLPGKLSRQIDYLRENPACRAVYSNAITVDESGMEIGLFNDVGDAKIDLPAMLRRGNFLNNSSILFRAEDIPGWTDIVQQIDYQVHLWLARNSWLGHIGEPLAAYRVSVEGSLVTSSNEHVRELYWRAIESVPRELVSDDDYAHGVADFLRRVFYRAVRTRDMTLLRTWSKRAYTASPYGAIQTTRLVVVNTLRAGWKVLLGNLRGGRYSRVLYRR